MENLLIKEVGFNGGTSIAVQDNERLKIQNDLVLIQVGRKIVPLTNGINKGVLCIEFDLPPLLLKRLREAA